MIFDLFSEALSRPIGLHEPRPRFGWRLAGHLSAARQTARRIELRADSPEGALLWDSGRVESPESQWVPYGGPELGSRQSCHWRVCVWADQGADEGIWSEWSRFEMGLLRASDWSAQWIAAPGEAAVSWKAAVRPAPRFRRVFDLGQAPVRARLYVSGLGYHLLYLNGSRVGDAELAEAPTHFDRRAFYRAHDITALLRAGRNALGIELGNGWYNPHTPDVWHFDKASWRDHPKTLAQIELVYPDGRVERIASGRGWRVSEGPVVFDGLRNGEHYDARRETPGWSRPEHDDSDWAEAKVVPGPGGLLVTPLAEPCRVQRTLRAVSSRTLDAGVRLFDFGENIAGRTLVRATGAAGAELVVRHGEVLSADGRLDQSHIGSYILGGDTQTDRLTLAGAGLEEREPAFVYHGFQYAEVSGPSGVVAACDVEARVLRADFAAVGSFRCADERVNRLHAAALRSYEGNFVELPTDCPHREKNGWTGDAHLAAELGLLHFASGNAYRDWLETFAEAQRPNGQLPSIAPTAGWGYNWGSGPAWDSALLIIPWEIFRHSGDSAAIARHYEAAKRYVAYLDTLADEGLVRFGLGDWCHPEAKRILPSEFTSTAFFHSNCVLLARFARVLGREDETTAYERKAAAIAAAFRARFQRGCGVYGDGSITAQGCVLHHGLALPGEEAAVASALARAVETAGARCDFGILGAKYVLRELSRHGYADLAWRVVTQTNFPGWMHWIERGATTLWEDWHGNSSRNHVMFGDVAAWLFTDVAGLRPDDAAPGMRKVEVEPFFPAGLAHAEAMREGPYGRLRVSWRREAGSVVLEVEVPANCEARVHPGANAETVVVGPGRHSWTLQDA
jgi:alpha-L-rhamnosidase